MGAPNLSLNLAQRKVVQQFQDNNYKTWKAAFDKVVGCQIAVEPMWDSFFNMDSNKRTDETIMSGWQEFYFDTLMATFKKICSNDMGKSAVKKGVKKIVITGVNTTNSKASLFKDGVFELNHSPIGYSDSLDVRATKWQQIIEAGL